MSELKITKEKVLEAAKGCKDVERVFKTLWPEVFEEGFVFDRNLVGLSGSGWLVYGYKSSETPCIGIKTLNNQDCFYLDASHDWKLDGNYLIPTKK